MKAAIRRVGLVDHNPRRGAALLEVIVALAVLAIAGISLLTLAVQSERAVSDARDGVRELRLAHAFMESVALWARADLDRHLGRRPEGPFVLMVDHVAPALYRVVLYDAPAGGHPARALLETTLFREVQP